MILVCPPCGPPDPRVSDAYLYVLMCEDRACFVLNLNEALRAQSSRAVDFVPWYQLDDERKRKAIEAIREHLFLADAA